uniref:E3 ubiquitin-protein ligase MARCH3 n=1 Tax=Schistosoma japonicum TaxID=6182 RepID=C1L4N6_SCHJA|nr:E3 ubiquitin-protein ligase MARCH3 [Schistosoma japonicum]
MNSQAELCGGFSSRPDSRFSGRSLMTNSDFSKAVSQYEWKNKNKVDEIYCRICLGSTDFEDLISPCHCTGTIGIVHQRCLEKWLNLSRLRTCEICGYKFEILKSYPRFITLMCCIFYKRINLYWG